MTAYTTQRKVWYDGTNYWRSYYDEALTAIRFDYSTQVRLALDPDDWTENSSARITDIGVSHDFCVRGDSSDLYIVYSDGTDILGRKDSTYPATNFTWAASSIVFDGSADGGTYYRACVAKDAAGTRLNVCAALNVTAGNTWSLNVRRATAADTIPTTAAPTKTLVSGLSSLQCSTIRRGDATTAGSLIAVWKEGYTDLKSAYRNGPDNVPAGGDDWEATQSIVTAADCSTEPGNGFTLTNVLNTGETLLIYINSDGKAALRTRPPGSSQSWSAEDTLSNTSGDTYPALGEHALYHFHLVWLNSSGVIVQREYKATTDLYTPSISPYQAPATVISSLGASWLQVSDETPIAYMIWQLGAAVRAYVLGITAVSTTTTSTSTTTTSTSSSVSTTSSSDTTTSTSSSCSSTSSTASTLSTTTSTYSTTTSTTSSSTSSTISTTSTTTTSSTATSSTSSTASTLSTTSSSTSTCSSTESTISTTTSTYTSSSSSTSSTCSTISSTSTTSTSGSTTSTLSTTYSSSSTSSSTSSTDSTLSTTSTSSTSSSTSSTASTLTTTSSSVSTSTTTTIDSILLAYNKSIIIDSDKVIGTADLTDFPMLFDHTANYIKHTGSGGQVTSEDGYDILFTDADGLIQLDHEIESYTPSTGHLVAWVRIPTLEYDSDTTIKLTWGDGSIETSQENAAGVWQDDFEAVWHFDETSGNHIDSTGHGNTGAPSVTTQGSATGKIDGCDAFDGVDDEIIVASTSRLDALTAVSIEVWALTTDNSQDDQTVINLRKDAIDRAYLVYDKTANIGFILYDDIDDVSQWRCRSDLIPTNDQWYYLVWTMDGTNWRLRIKSGASTWNESEVAGNTLEYLDDGYNVYIGRRTGEGDRPWKGRIDEVCISSTPRSNDWIDTRFNSMNSPSTFYSLESGTTTTTTTTTRTTTSTPPP